MKNAYTLNDLIHFAFNGAQKSLDNKNSEEMQTEEDIHQDYQDMMEILSWPESSFGTPDRRTINNILNYSRSLSVYKSKSIGVINMLLN